MNLSRKWLNEFVDLPLSEYPDRAFAEAMTVSGSTGGAVVGGILNAVGIVRALVFLNREKLKATHPAWLAGFTTVYLLSYILTFTVFGKEPTLFNLVVEFLPVIGMTATTISFRLSDAKAIRRFGLISSPSWLVYNIVTFSVGAIICEVLSLGSIFIGMFRHDRKK